MQISGSNVSRGRPNVRRVVPKIAALALGQGRFVGPSPGSSLPRDATPSPADARRRRGFVPSERGVRRARRRAIAGRVLEARNAATLKVLFLGTPAPERRRFD